MGPDRIGSLDRNKLEIFASDMFSKFGFQRDDCFLVQNSTASEKLNVLSYQATSFIVARSQIEDFATFASHYAAWHCQTLWIFTFIPDFEAVPENMSFAF